MPLLFAFFRVACFFVALCTDKYDIYASGGGGDGVCVWEGGGGEGESPEVYIF